ncbi:MAG: hypothetical protein HZB99_00870 [Candidatus Harrisonbacteria bacterium]|nr:hypothetical protein [Candidatus Harrisonbacteria bacterium]
MKSLMSHSRKCLLWKLLWLASAVSLVMAWVAVWSRGLVAGLEPLAWYWNALVLAALATPIKMDCSDCGTCMPSGQQ